MSLGMVVQELDIGQRDEAVDVLCDAFADYPTMRFVIGGVDEEVYRERLRQMVDFFTTARFANRDLVLGVVDPDRQIIGVANVTLPGDRPKSPELKAIREALWRGLGADAQDRYETFGRIWQTFADPRPHYHLNMLGVRRSRHRHGAARLLLDALHERSAGMPENCGVRLETEDPANVPFYQRFGYAITGHAQVSPGIETWCFFRPKA